MSIKSIMAGTHAGDFGQPLDKKDVATTISKTGKAAKFSPEGSALSCKLHHYAITCSKNQRLPWVSRVEGLIEIAGAQIQENDYSGARATLEKIRLNIYGK